MERRLRAGRLHPVHRGVYAVGHRHLTQQATFVAAVLAIGGDAALSYVSAAVHYGFMTPRAGTWVHVTTTRQIMQRTGIRIHFVRNLAPAHVTTRHGLRLTTPIRTVLELATILDFRALTRAVHEAQVQGVLTHEDLSERARAECGRPGAKRLAAVLAPGPARTRSGLEDRFLELLAGDGLPRPETNVSLDDVPGRPEVDLLFPDHRLVVEVDSARYHDTPQRRRQDQEKQARIEAHGYRVQRARENGLTAAVKQIKATLMENTAA